ncbi:MAG TPA: ABC transporter permease [Thermoanaerobaculia bacterium]|jgi:predicted permease|nr:ABC transporter permease [Thermoanaerobaculia bacterium]
MMNLWFDFKYAWRLLARSWGYSLMCTSVVALSVGLAVWTYTLLYSQSLKPLPIRGSGRWYSIQLAADAKGTARPYVDAYTYQEMLARTANAEHLGAFSERFAILSEGQASRSLRAAAVSPRLFTATGAPPILGRAFAATDGLPGAAAVGVLSYEAWQTYFAGDRGIVGRTTRIDTRPVQIIGVLPQGFIAFEDYELWVPLHLQPVARPGDSTMMLTPLLVADKGDVPALTRELQTAVARVNAAHPSLFNAKRHVELFPAARIYSHANAPIVFMVAFLAAGVLLLAGVNISMVFLARLMERSRELALRTALGASRQRLLRQSLIETALVVASGLVGGYGLAYLGVRWAHGIADYLRVMLSNGSDGNVPTMRPADMVIGAGAATAVWLLSTLIPAWRVTKADPAAILAGSGKGTATRGNNRSVGLLVGLQVVISCVVLVACGNLVLSVRAETNKPNGLRSGGVVVSTTASEFGPRYSDGTQRIRYWDELQAAIQRRVPGSTVAFSTSGPTRPGRVTAIIETQQSNDKQGTFTLPVAAVSDDYFRLLGITARSGRLFDRTDNRSTLDVAVIDEQLAERYWPGQNVIGKRVQFRESEKDARWLTIVGVTSAVSGRPYKNDETGVVYRSIRQAAPADFRVLVRPPNAAADVRPAMRAAAYSVDRDLPLHNLQKLDDYLRAVNLSYAAMVPLFIVIALITALLAASGLFGLISRSVAQRTQEVGIRRALGGTSWRATSMFRRQGVLYLAVAIVGAGLGILITTQMSAVFPNILESVPTVGLSVMLLMTAVVFTASYLPTRRAVALEPGDALRYE